MANQATLKGDGAADSWDSEPSEAGPVSHVARDVIELAELQARLFKLDVAASSARVRTALILAGAGAVILCMGLLLALVVAALALIEFADWAPWIAFGTVALTVLVISAILLLSARGIARRGVFTWKRSRDELQQNIAWVKSALTSKHLTTRNADRGARAM